MKGDKLRKLRDKLVRIQLRQEVGDNITGRIRWVHTNGFTILDTRWGDIQINNRAIEDVTELRVPKLKAGE